MNYRFFTCVLFGFVQAWGFVLITVCECWRFRFVLLLMGSNLVHEKLLLFMSSGKKKLFIMFSVNFMCSSLIWWFWSENNRESKGIRVSVMMIGVVIIRFGIYLLCLNFYESGKLFFSVLEKLEEKRVLILFCDCWILYCVSAGFFLW